MSYWIQEIELLKSNKRITALIFLLPAQGGILVVVENVVKGGKLSNLLFSFRMIVSCSLVIGIKRTSFYLLMNCLCQANPL